MKKKNKKYSVLKSASHFVVVFLFCFWVNGSFAQTQTISKTFTPATTLTVDNNTENLTPINFTASDFPSDCILVQAVTVSVTWLKTSGSCATPDAGNAFHAETGFAITGPTGASTSLVNTGAWSGGTPITTVTTLFDGAATNAISGTPTSNSFLPSGSLEVFKGIDPLGDWQLSATDTAGGDPLCVESYTVSITVSTADFDNDTVYDFCDEDDDNDGILDTVECVSGTVNQNVTGGSGGSTTDFSVDNVVAATFNFERVDNSVEILINGNSLNANNVLQLEFAVSSGEVFLELASDGATMSQPWIANDNGLPRLQVIIDENGFVSFNGTRTTTSASLEPLRARDGSSFNVMSFLGGSNDFRIINPDQGGADGIDGTVVLTTCSNVDGDANLDFRDTDADDDGCADAFEGASTAITGGLSTLSGGSPTAGSSSQNLGTSSDAEGNPLVGGVEFIQATAPAVTNAAISIACTVDVSLQKSVNNALPKVGQNINYTITITNSGPLDATGVVVSDALPTGLTYVSDVPAAGTSYNNASGDWDIGVINVGEIKTLVITATVNQAGVIVNTAQVSQLDQTDVDSTTP